MTPLIHWAYLDDDDNTFSVACGAIDATEVYVSANTEPDLVTCPACAAACDTITRAAQ